MVDLWCIIGEKRLSLSECVCAGACGNEMEQQHEAPTDIGLGAVLRRGSEARHKYPYFRVVPAKIAPESPWWPSCV